MPNEFTSMNRFFTFFLAGLVLLHATFGCCLHHAHACDVDCCDAPAATMSDCSCEEHQEDNSPIFSSSKECSSPGHDSHHCTGDACTFMASLSSHGQYKGVGGEPTAIAHRLGDIAAERKCSISAKPKIPLGSVFNASHLHLALSILLI